MAFVSAAVLAACAKPRVVPPRAQDPGTGATLVKCPGSGRLAPVMQTQAIALNGCTPNAYPFTADGVFVTGTWTAS